MNRLKAKWVCITGATAGIGKAAAGQFAEAGANLIITGRREERLQSLAAQLIETYKIEVHTAAFDVSNLQACRDFVDALPAEIDILVNNAGFAKGIDPVFSANIDDWSAMIDTNIKGVLYLTRLISPQMKKRNSGHIINIGSISGHETYKGGAVYCATKHAVKAITEATKKDLLGTRVRVSMISPGLVETEFSEVRFSGDTDKASSVYKGLDPLVAGDIAEIILFIANRPPHVNIMDTIVFPLNQASSSMVHRDA